MVIHNFSSADAKAALGGFANAEMVVSNGKVSVSGNNVTLGGYSSVVFIQSYVMKRILLWAVVLVLAASCGNKEP